MAGLRFAKDYYQWGIVLTEHKRHSKTHVQQLPERNHYWAKLVVQAYENNGRNDAQRRQILKPPLKNDGRARIDFKTVGYCRWQEEHDGWLY
jgi:hypothetical protein